MRDRRLSRGFTLIELVISVAIIGVLAAIAIPAFSLYQMRSKRSEAYTNLEGIRKVQISYFAEFGSYVDSVPSPRISMNGDKQNWLGEGDHRFYFGPAGTGFEALGWVPEGATYFDYDTYAVVGADGPYFTSAAYGDVDNDGNLSVFLYARPDNAGNTLPCWQCTGGVVPVVTWSGPPVSAYGDDILSTVAPLLPPNGDDF